MSDTVYYYVQDVFEADASARNEGYREVGPVCALLLVVKWEQYALPLLVIESRKESICGAHDS